MDYLARTGVPDPGRMRIFTLIDVHGALEYTSKDFRAGKTQVFCSFRTDQLPGSKRRAAGSQRNKELLQAIGECRSSRELLVKFPAVGIPYHAGVNAFYHARDGADPRDRVRVFWFFGKAGTGKTYAAVSLAAYLAQKFDPDVGTYRDPFYVANSTVRWFDNYEGQRVMVIDELRW